MHDAWKQREKFMPVLGPLYRRWLLFCDDTPSWPMVVLPPAEADVGMALGLGTVVGNVCERGKFFKWGLGSLLTSSGILSLLSSLSCLCQVWRDSSPRDCCLWSYMDNSNTKRVNVGRKMHRIQDRITHAHVHSYLMYVKCMDAHLCRGIFW